jgi:uncharacterized protein involved in exopolysaccharide biosynthesis
MNENTLFGEPFEYGRNEYGKNESETKESDKKEARHLDTLKNLDGMISTAIEKIRTLKEEKAALERRIKDLEAMLDEKNGEIVRLAAEKNSVKGQIEGLLSELEGIGL